MWSVYPTGRTCDPKPSIFVNSSAIIIYKDVHPEYASYLYLMAPISLAILNPIGLVLMEISKIIKNKEEVVST